MTFKIQDTNGKGLPDYPQDIELADITVYIHDSMMFATHNYPCPVCKVNSAVYNMSNGSFNHAWIVKRKVIKLLKLLELSLGLVNYLNREKI